ncbi:CAP domain-containing protein (plasmid) [Kitasatospora sp. NBC_00070]|uniref:CAP domain-containing protein n=1 Tax=Kitasatospora sp. NBC_00070 TaxID=2975962 RepID=UPI002F91B49B
MYDNLPRPAADDPADDGTAGKHRRGDSPRGLRIALTGAAALLVVATGGYIMAAGTGPTVGLAAQSTLESPAAAGQGASGQPGGGLPSASSMPDLQQPGTPGTAYGSSAPVPPPSSVPPSDPSLSAAAKSPSGPVSPARPAKGGSPSSATQPSHGAGGGPVTGAGAGDRVIQQVTDLVNKERALVGCGPVTVNAKLNRAAQVHSDDMVARHYFEHEDPENRHADSRITAAGYNWRSWGENIAYGQADAAEVMDTWMHSPSHKSNILNCGFKEIGVGITLADRGPWWTQVFASAK